MYPKGKGCLAISISGEGLMYLHPDPEKKDVFGDHEKLYKDIFIFGSLGSCVAPLKVIGNGYSFLCDSDGRNTTGKDQILLNVQFDCAVLEGYEGPLFAQVVGPWPASKAVQVADVMTEEKRIAHAAEQTHRKFLDQLKIAFAQIDSNHDGYVTQDEVEKTLGGPENVQQIRERMAKAESEMQGVAWTFMYAGAALSMDGVPSEADVKKLQALLALKGDAKLSLNDLRSMN